MAGLRLKARALTFFALPRILARLKAAYHEGGVEALYAAHQAARRLSASYRLAYRLIDLVFPFSAGLEMAAGFEGQVSACGLYRAANAVLDRLSVPRETRFPEREKEKILAAPCVIFSNHPSMMAPIVVAASLDRADLAIIALNALEKLGPCMAKHVLPIQPSWRLNLRRDFCGGVTHAVAALLLAYLDPRQDVAQAHAHNRTTLNRAAAHVLDGRAVLIFPQGGGASRQKWYTGIGILISRLAQASSAGTIYIVPARIENDSNARLQSLLSTNPVLRLHARAIARPPVRVIFERPIPLESLVARQGLDPHRITLELETRYALR